MVKKLVSSLLIVAAVIAVVPVGASAEWKSDNTGWWYTEGDSYLTGWKQMDGAWYYFGNDGYMKKGWLQDGGTWYYFQDNGAMATGKIITGGKVYEFDSNGKWINNSVANTIVSKTASVAGVSQDKINSTPNYSWFNDNGKTYFKMTNNEHPTGTWNIDGDTYIFDKDGVLQKGEYTSTEGKKYILGNDGKFLKCVGDDSFKLHTGKAMTTKSNTDNSLVKLNDSNLMNIAGVYSSDKAKKSVNLVSISGRTLYCKTNQIITLGDIKVRGAENLLFPKLVIRGEDSDKDAVNLSYNLSLDGGFYKNIQPEVIVHKAGKTTVTIDINGVKTSFDVVATD